MQKPLMGRQIKVDGAAARCDYDGPGHLRLISPGKIGYQIRDGEAQGMYHGRQCYEAALKRYRGLKEQMDISSEVDENE